MLEVIWKKHKENAPHLGVLCSAVAPGAVHAIALGWEMGMKYVSSLFCWGVLVYESGTLSAAQRLQTLRSGSWGRK